MKVIEYNSKTGITTERELTAEEIARMEAMQNEVQPETQPTPTLEERVAKTETKVVSMEEIINTIFL